MFGGGSDEATWITFVKAFKVLVDYEGLIEDRSNYRIYRPTKSLGHHVTLVKCSSYIVYLPSYGMVMYNI